MRLDILQGLPINLFGICLHACQCKKSCDRNAPQGTVSACKRKCNRDRSYRAEEGDFVNRVRDYETRTNIFPPTYQGCRGSCETIVDRAEMERCFLACDVQYNQNQGMNLAGLPLIVGGALVLFAMGTMGREKKKR